MAAKAMKLIQKSVLPVGQVRSIDESIGCSPEKMPFPELLQPVTSVAWAVAHESCCTLEDYLRRRTNIAQWIPGGGLGENNVNAPLLKTIALQIAEGDVVVAETLFDNYCEKVKDDFAFKGVVTA
jgi:hypothetical protein